MSDTQGFEALQSLSSNPQPDAAAREPQIDKFGRAYATGKRKNAIAKVWIKPGKGSITINGRDQEVYFARPVLRMMIAQPLKIADRLGQFDVIVSVEGSGLSGQAGAVRHGLSRANRGDLLVICVDKHAAVMTELETWSSMAQAGAGASEDAPAADPDFSPAPAE